jgi:hypothetical protein
MKRKALRLLLSAALLAPGLAAAQQPLDPVRFEGVLMAARSYAVDVSLVNYCLRLYDEQRPFLYYAVQLDLEKALDTLKAANADAGQNARFVEAVLANVRFSPRTPATRCSTGAASRAKSRRTTPGISASRPPLYRRPPLDKLGR